MTADERKKIEAVAHEIEEQIGTFFGAGNDQLTQWVRDLRALIRRVPVGRGVPRARRIPKRRSI